MPQFSSNYSLSLIQQKDDRARDSNRPRNYLDIMRYALCEILSEMGLTDEERDMFRRFIREAPDHVIEDLGAQLRANILTSERLLWQATLEEFFESEPPRYDDHKHEYANAPDFLKKVWGEFIKQRVLYLDRLSQYDPKLIPAVRRYWQLHGRSDDDVDAPQLPPPRQSRTKTILEHVATVSPYSIEEIIRAAIAENRSRQRHLSSG